MDYRTLGLQSDFDRYGRRTKSRIPIRLIYVVGVLLIVGMLLPLLNIYELHKMKEDHAYHMQGVPVVEGRTGQDVDKRPVVWVAGKKIETGYLRHVFNVFERIGYIVSMKPSDWEVLWSHDYPFTTFAKDLSDLKPHQKVNHFPGSGFITNKASLASTDMPFIPKAFKMPKQKEKFLEYIKHHPNTSWVQKSNNHRGIEIKNVKDLDLSLEGTFLQEYVTKPFLIDGRKFDIGVYTILTSIDPLRVYIVNGDYLFRFCSKDYYPFDAKIRDKYVVGDDYTPVWKIPSLKNMYSNMEYTFKETINYGIRKAGKNPDKMWHDIKEAILTVYKEKEINLIEAARKYKTTRNFFEMVRFDFVLDEELNVYLMEANMSPNLSSSHFKENTRLYEHVVFNLLNLVGLARSVPTNYHKSSDDTLMMQVSDRDISVFPQLCVESCSQSCQKLECKLCHKCLSVDLRYSLKTAYLEHKNRITCQRLFPPAMNHKKALKWTLDTADESFHKLRQSNKLMYMWFVGKCQLDPAFCI